jgi:RND superfamily putative drug exporter
VEYEENIVQRLMLRLHHWLRRHRVLVLGIWLAALIAALPFAAQQSDHLTGGGFEAAGSQSQRVQEAMARDFPSIPSATLAVVLVPHGDAGPDDLSRATQEIGGTISTVPDVSTAGTPGAQPGPAIIPLVVAGGESKAIDAAKDLRGRFGITAEHAGTVAAGRVDVHVIGQGALFSALQDESKKGVTEAETRGFPIIAIVLLAVFGSLAATAVPLSLGIMAVVITGGVIYLLSLGIEMSIYVTNMASMIGIGVAVDYSLFVLMRYREEIRAGRGLDEARAAAMATSGVAVIFSGATVVASLAGLLLIGSPAISSMALGAIMVVAVSVLTASTLLPVLIGLFGRHAHTRARWLRLGAEKPEKGFWARWAGAVMRRPALFTIAAAAVLVVMAVPALELKVGNSALRQLSADHEIRKGVDAASALAGPGAQGPAEVLVTFSGGTAGDPANQQMLQRIRGEISRDPLVWAVSAPLSAQDGRSALLTTTFTVDAEASEARDAVERLRARLPATVYVGGTTAVILDFDNLVSDSMWMIFVFVFALSFVTLLISLRSVVLALKAVLMTVLSVAATYGAVVAVFQWGWLEFLGLQRAEFIDTLTPPLVLAVAFGLSMDYEIFLLSRIRERYQATGDTRRAVGEGLSSSARTITSAALIMVAVFLAFVSAGLPAVQRLGFACAVAIAVDATIVRLVLVPATMVLLDRWNWWLPAPLARRLPAVNFERVEQVEQVERISRS